MDIWLIDLHCMYLSIVRQSSTLTTGPKVLASKNWLGLVKIGNLEVWRAYKGFTVTCYTSLTLSPTVGIVVMCYVLTWKKKQNVLYMVQRKQCYWLQVWCFSMFHETRTFFSRLFHQSFVTLFKILTRWLYLPLIKSVIGFGSGHSLLDWFEIQKNNSPTGPIKIKSGLWKSPVWKSEGPVNQKVFRKDWSDTIKQRYPAVSLKFRLFMKKISLTLTHKPPI